MRRLVTLVLGMLGGVVVYLLATQLVLLTAGSGGDGLAPRLVGVLAAAALVAAAVMVGRWWPTMALAGAAVVALLVSISLVTFEGGLPTGMLLSATDLMRYGASSPLPVAIAAAGGVAALTSRDPRSRAGAPTTTEP